jgi:hypothetical protein
VTEVPREFLVRVDSYASLVAYRYPGGVPADVVEELKRISAEARTAYEAEPESV